MRLVTAVLLVVGSCVSAEAGPTDVSADLAAVLVGHKNVPGIVAIELQDDRVVLAGAAGVRKAGDKSPMTVDDQVHLGSDTKAMTAVLVGQLIDQKLLSMSTRMDQVFPDLAPLKMDPQMAGVTVAQLLQHLGSLPHDLNWGAIEKVSPDVTEQRRAAVERALSVKPVEPPGTKYEYSNVGYVILGAVIEAKTGKPWETVIQKELLDPLGMKSAGFGPPGKPGEVDQPWGHVLRAGQLVALQEDNPPVMGPAGRVHCTIRDWAKFVARFETGKGDHLPGVSTETFTRFMQPGSPGDYGGGWIQTTRKWANGPVLTHAGSNTMWYCVTWVAPRTHRAYLVAVNAAGKDASQACDEAVQAMMK